MGISVSSKMGLFFSDPLLEKYRFPMYHPHFIFKSCVILLALLVSSLSRAEGLSASFPVDPSITHLSVVVVFPPTKRDRGYDLLDQTGGFGYHFQSSELHFMGEVPALVQSLETILQRLGTLSEGARTVSLSPPTSSLEPSTRRIDWSNGVAFDIPEPATGLWTITLTGSGEYKLRVSARTSFSLDAPRFVEPAGAALHEGYRNKDFVRANSTEFLNVKLKEDGESDLLMSASRKKESLQVELLDWNGMVLSTSTLHRAGLSSYLAEVTVPTHPFRVGVKSVTPSMVDWRREEVTLRAPEPQAPTLSISQQNAIRHSLQQIAEDSSRLERARVFVREEAQEVLRDGYPLGIHLLLEYENLPPENLPPEDEDDDFLPFIESISEDGNQVLRLLPRSEQTLQRGRTRRLAFLPDFVHLEREIRCHNGTSDIIGAMSENKFQKFTLIFPALQQRIPLRDGYTTSPWVTTLEKLRLYPCPLKRSRDDVGVKATVEAIISETR